MGIAEQQHEFEQGGMAACPACVVAPLAQAQAQVAPRGRLMLSLPAAHCAACISTVESALAAVPGVESSRVNLTMKRVSVDARPEVTAEALVAVLAGVGYEAHELDAGLLSATEMDKQGRELLMRLGVAFFSMMNVMLLSVAVWSGAEGATRDMFHWISAAIAVPTVIFCGQPFFRSAWAGLKVGRLGMDFPISLALVLASSISLFETIKSGHHAYFDAAVMLCFFLLLGRYLDHRTRAVARSAAEELAALEVPRAVVLVDGVEVVRAISEVAAGDLVRVRPGGRMPVDGVVEGGASEVDRSLLTGESLPVFVGPGMVVAAGEVNLTGPLLLRVTAAGRDSQPAPDGRSGGGGGECQDEIHHVGGTRRAVLLALGAYPVVQCLWLLDVGDRGRSALCDQYLGGGFDHHLPLCFGVGGAGGGDGGLGKAVPQGFADQTRHRAGAAGAG